jgi:membrane-bound ClpP family serine protease
MSLNSSEAAISILFFAAGLSKTLRQFRLAGFAFRRLLPQTSIGRSMINASSNEGSAVPAAAGYAVYVGKTGKAATVLAPSGTIEIDGTLIEAFSLDGFVERGAAVVVTEAGSGRVTVRRSR